MKNITDYFENPEKDGPNRVSEKDPIETKCGSSKMDEKSDKKKHKSNKKMKIDHYSKSSILTSNGLIDETQEIINTVLQNSNVLQDEEKHVENISDEDSIEQTTTEMKPDKKNAFLIMMESRNKSIGTNSPGKELDPCEIINKCDHAKTLSARKKILSEWANFKGSAKRKREEEDRDQIIKSKLEKRSERMKKLLVGNVHTRPSSEDFEEMKISKKKRNKVSRKLSSSSNSSVDEFKNGFVNNKKIKKKTAEGKQYLKTKSYDNSLITKNAYNIGHILIDENNENLLKKIKENSIGSAPVNDVLKEKSNLSSNTNYQILNNIVDESSQESLSTPPALRSWRMRIKLNINENDVQTVGENIKQQNVNNNDLEKDTEGEFFVHLIF